VKETLGSAGLVPITGIIGGNPRNMVGAVLSITEGRGSNFFLFVDRETLVASGPLNVEWTTGKGKESKWSTSYRRLQRPSRK
jgi:hypothetical protein